MRLRLGRIVNPLALIRDSILDSPNEAVSAKIKLTPINSKLHFMTLTCGMPILVVRGQCIYHQSSKNPPTPSLSQITNQNPPFQPLPSPYNHHLIAPHSPSAPTFCAKIIAVNSAIFALNSSTLASSPSFPPSSLLPVLPLVIGVFGPVYLCVFLLAGKKGGVLVCPCTAFGVGSELGPIFRNVVVGAPKYHSETDSETQIRKTKGRCVNLRRAMRQPRMVSAEKHMRSGRNTMSGMRLSGG